MDEPRMEKKPGAFPPQLGQYKPIEILMLTKREYFAAMAMQGMLAFSIDGPSDQMLPSVCAWDSVKYADALIAELAKENNP